MVEIGHKDWLAARLCCMRRTPVLVRFIVLVLTGMGFSVPSAFANGATLSPQQMQEDLVYLRDVWAPRERSFSAAQRRAFDDAIATAIANVDAWTPAVFALEVSRALALAHNVHSRSTLGEYFRGLPVEAAWFEDGLFVVRAHPRYASLLGARIVKFGPLSAEEAYERVAPFVSGIESYVRSMSPEYLRLFEVLQKIGATDMSGEVVLRTVQGHRYRQTKFVASETADSDVRGPALVRDEKSSWRHVLQFAPQVPLIHRESNSVSAHWLDEIGFDGVDRTLYVVCSDLSETAGTSISRKLADIVVNEVLARRARNVIVDLRLNSGGNVMNAFLFSYLLPRLLPPNGRIYVLIGPRTLSAAIAMTAMLKARGKGSVVIVGEPAGDRPQFWADSERRILPHSKLIVAASRAYEDWENGCDDLDRCMWLNVALADSKVDLRPEMRVPTTFQDYSRGHDAVLTAVVERLR